MRAIERLMMLHCTVRTHFIGPLSLYFALLLITVFAAATSAAQNPKNCLDQVHVKSGSSGNEATFDKLFDSVNGGNASISCYLYIPASKARDALESFRYGVLYHDKASLDRVFRYPLQVIMSNPSGSPVKQNRVIVHNFQEWSTLQDTEMTKSQLQVIRCSWLGNVSLVGGQSFHPGFIVGDGLVFFGTSDISDVRIASVDLMPITSEMLARSCAQ
jgi:hypothetical protein